MELLVGTKFHLCAAYVKLELYGKCSIGWAFMGYSFRLEHAFALVSLS